MTGPFNTIAPMRREELYKGIASKLKELLGPNRTLKGNSGADEVTLTKLPNNNIGVTVVTILGSSDQAGAAEHDKSKPGSAPCQVYEIGPSGSISSMKTGRCAYPDLSLVDETKVVPEQQQHQELLSKLQSVKR